MDIHASGVGVSTLCHPRSLSFGCIRVFVNLYLYVELLFFVFITCMGSRRDKKRRDQLSKITKHDRVRTRGGIIGSVVEAKDDQLVIKVDESRDTRITLDRQYVDAILETSGSED